MLKCWDRVMFATVLLLDTRFSCSAVPACEDTHAVCTDAPTIIIPSKILAFASFTNNSLDGSFLFWAWRIWWTTTEHFLIHLTWAQTHNSEFMAYLLHNRTSGCIPGCSDTPRYVTIVLLSSHAISFPDETIYCKSSSECIYFIIWLQIFSISPVKYCCVSAEPHGCVTAQCVSLCVWWLKCTFL